MLARLLAPNDFGLVALGTTLIVVATAFTELSMNQALVHSREPTRDHYNTAWTLGVCRGLLLATIFALAAPFIAEMYKEPRLDNIMYALAIGTFLSGLQNPRLVSLQRNLQFHQTFLIGSSAMLVNVASAISVAVIYKSYWALIVGTLAGQVTGLILSYSMFPYRPDISFGKFRELWSFSVWVSLGQIANTLNYRFDQFLVGTFAGRSELGLYTVGSRIAILPGQEIVRPLTTTLFPAFSLVRDDQNRLRRAYQRVQGLVTSIALPASVGFGLIADPAVRLLLGPKWHDAIPVVQMIAVLYSLDTLGSLVAPLGMSSGQTRTLFIRNLQKLAIRAPLLAGGLALGGLMGLLYGRMIAGVVGVIVDMVMIDRIIGLSVLSQLRANFRCFAATAAMSAVTLGIQPFLPVQTGVVMQVAQIAMIVALAVAVYVITTWVLWRISRRPDGPEREIIDVAGKVVRRLKREQLSPK